MLEIPRGNYLLPLAVEETAYLPSKSTIVDCFYSVVLGDDVTPNSKNVTWILRAEVTVNGQTRLNFLPRARHGVARQAGTSIPVSK